MPAPRPPPRWAKVLRAWLQQTSTRTGLVFLLLSAAGIVLTEQQATAIMAFAGAVAALLGLIWPDRADP